MRKVFLDKLPTKDGVGKNTGRRVIDWEKAVGEFIEFNYDDIDGKIKIIDYKKTGQQLRVTYHDKEFKINTSNFIKGKLGRLLDKFGEGFRVEVGQVFKDNKRHIIITDKKHIAYRHKPNKNGVIYTQSQKWYKYRCGKCKWEEGWIQEWCLLDGQGCSCCSGKVAVIGINTIWDTNRDWIEKFGVSKEDAKKYTNGSGKKINVKCPHCEEEKLVVIGDIYNYNSIGCTCGGGFSYPEKFMHSVLKQLGVEHIAQLSKTTFKWCDKYRYDFYLPDYNIIIETHGGQHYEEQNRGRSLKEEQKNDRIKKELALNNGIDKHIVIDCRKSELDWIKNSILNSNLKKILDLSKVDWIKCEEFALKNIVKEVCSYWNEKEDWETTQTIANNNEWGIKSKDCISRYLKIGSKHGWCKYKPEEEIKNKRGRLLGKPIEVFKDNISVGLFKSCAELDRQSDNIFGFKLNYRSISLVCIGKQKSYKGFTFKYIEDQQRAC